MSNTEPLSEDAITEKLDDLEIWGIETFDEKRLV